jgi:hypothetical protein
MKPFGLFGGNEPTPPQEPCDAYNQRKLQEIADHDAGFDAGGQVNETKSTQYQYGQIARRETDESELHPGKFYCGHCGWVDQAMFLRHSH